MIEVQDLTVKIKSKTIIQDISFKVEPGQFVGVIGGNGSGKSTLLKTIYKHIKPSNGKISVCDMDLDKLSHADLAKQMAVVGQFNNMELDYSVLEFVTMGRYPHKKKYEKMNEFDYKIVSKALKTMSMDNYSERMISSLSGGEKQRAVIARALVQQPKILVLDEPTNHLDISHQIQLLKILKELKITIVAVLHDLSFAHNFCDKIIALHAGKLVLFEEPENAFTTKNLKSIFDIHAEIIRLSQRQGIALFYPKS